MANAVKKIQTQNRIAVIESAQNCIKNALADISEAQYLH